ncbi:hypothetical protein LCGC14_1083170 [marine sediment metagenome]|uniref:Uncharacterized protein n=1 Tax=marine sediment metagenome TaxID=412755 RepID=A0A0F9PXV7_9ZZZZ
MNEFKKKFLLDNELLNSSMITTTYNIFPEIIENRLRILIENLYSKSIQIRKENGLLQYVRRLLIIQILDININNQELNEQYKNEFSFLQSFYPT